MIGFIGLGTMGLPMALNLVRSGYRLVVWNRSPGPCESLRMAGADVAPTAKDVCRRADVIVLMLLDSGVVDDVLDRCAPEFAALVAGRTIVHMGTTAPGYSRGLEADIVAAGGHYVEAPVSGSRVPAERGSLLGMIAGHPDSVAAVRHLLNPLCQAVVDCGAVPNATLAKLASNIVLLSTVTGLAEAVHAADRFGLSREALLQVVLGGPLASDVLKIKGLKLLADDFSPQASIANAMASGSLTRDAARTAGAMTPLLEVCLALYQRAHEADKASLDMVAVMHAVNSLS